MPSYNLQQYDRGPGAFASLVGGLIGGAETGYSARRRMTTDKQADADAERKRLMDAIRLRIELEDKGYNPDDLSAGESPAKEGGTFAPASPRSQGPKLGGTPPFVDPRNYGDASPELPGFAGLDPYQAPKAEEVADPFRRSTQDPGMAQGAARSQDPRSRVADILFQGVPKMQRGESAAERAARVSDERIGARESSRDSAFMDRERYQQGEHGRRQGEQLGAQERMNDADNRANLDVARINSSSRYDVASLRGPSAAADPQQRAMQRALGLVKERVGSLDKAIRMARATIPKMTPMEEISPRDREAYDERYAGTTQRITELEAQRADVERVRMQMIDRQLHGITEFRDLLSPSGARASAGEPRVDMRGRPVGGSSPMAAPSDTGNIDLRNLPPGGAREQAPMGVRRAPSELGGGGRPNVAPMMPTPAPGQPTVQRPAAPMPQAGARRRPLSAAEKAAAQRDPEFAAWLQQRYGYSVVDWR
jgi:hypothetical protein